MMSLEVRTERGHKHHLTQPSCHSTAPQHPDNGRVGEPKSKLTGILGSRTPAAMLLWIFFFLMKEDKARPKQSHLIHTKAIQEFTKHLHRHFPPTVQARTCRVIPAVFRLATCVHKAPTALWSKRTQQTPFIIILTLLILQPPVCPPP